MRTKRFVTGLNNNQRIRVICDGVGFVTTVAGAFDMPLTHQRIAVTSTLVALGIAVTQEPYTKALDASQWVYVSDGDIRTARRKEIPVQIDLL